MSGPQRIDPPWRALAAPVDEQTEDVLFLLSRFKRRPDGRLDVTGYRPAMMELLQRYDIPLSPTVRKLLRDALGWFWYPNQSREAWRRFLPELDREGINEIAANLKAQGVRNYRGEAEKQWAASQDVKVSTLRQRRYRKRPARRRRTRTLT